METVFVVVVIKNEKHKENFSANKHKENPVQGTTVSHLVLY